MPASDLLVCNLGVVEYREALALQERVRATRQADEHGDVLLLLEHHPVYTRGRRSEPGELPMGESWYLAQGIDVVETNRGGRVTYHGPAHVRTMERALIAALAAEGIEARARAAEGADYTGVWVEDRKIASIGVHVARGVSTHGFAVNVENDLQPFEWIVPCGLEGVRMTSVSKELHAPAPGILPRFRDTTTTAFATTFGRSARAVSSEELGLAPLPSG
jgi:lipoyl(octanoyl) transferase